MGVVLERSSNDEADINANRIPAIQSLLRRVNDADVYKQESTTREVEESDDSDSENSDHAHVDPGEMTKKRKRVVYPPVSMKSVKHVSGEYATGRRVARRAEVGAM